ncbi:hypothetical protein ACIBQX_19735 [Nonomuraea sp. NPDC049714]|uniref:hypothetical protein n=1 Tax=Nonomuraea sp. NPDC049714 TaxID=3364357 RepID=UPI0037968AF7
MQVDGECLLGGGAAGVDVAAAGVEGGERQYGQEPNLEEYMDNLRATFTEARRMLADDGPRWRQQVEQHQDGLAANRQVRHDQRGLRLHAARNGNATHSPHLRKGLRFPMAETRGGFMRPLTLAEVQALPAVVPLLAAARALGLSSFPVGSSRSATPTACRPSSCSF